MVNGRGGGVSTSNVAARGGVKGVVGPDLSKAQGENGFLLLRFYRDFFKKLWLMSNIQKSDTKH